MNRSVSMLVFLIVSVFFHQAQCQSKAGRDEGFISIFDGKTFANWEGDSVYWRIENGTLIGEVTPETVLKRNSFIIWRGGTVSDFELKLEYWVSAMGNSGVNYRSEELDTFLLKGYQADIEGRDRHTGQIYEERGRTFLARRGQKAVLEAGQEPVISTFGKAEELQQKIKKEDWNEIHIIAKGNHLQHYVNGVLMSEVIDHDKEKRKSEGLIGVQVHVGPPMIIKYRNIRLKKIR